MGKGKTMKSYFNAAESNPDNRARPASAVAREPVSMLELLRERLSFTDRDYDDSYEHVKPLADFWKILSRRSTGDRRHDLIENRRLQLPVNVPDTIVFDNYSSKPIWLYTEDGLLLKKPDFDVGDIYKFFDLDRKAVLRTYQDDVDTKKMIDIPVAVMKSAQGRCNSLKLMFGHDFREGFEEFMKQRFDMPTTVVQKYVKARGGYNHIVRVVWTRDMPLQKYIIRNQVPMSQGVFYAKVYSGNKNKKRKKIPVPKRSKEAILRAKSPKRRISAEDMDLEGGAGPAGGAEASPEPKKEAAQQKKPEVDEDGELDIVPTRAEAYSSLDDVMRRLLTWLGTEAGLEFDQFVCDFVDADEDDVVEERRKDALQEALASGGAAGARSPSGRVITGNSPPAGSNKHMASVYSVASSSVHGDKFSTRPGSAGSGGGFQLTGVFGPKAPKKKAKKEMLQLLQVRAFKIRPSRRFGFNMKIERKLDGKAFAEKLMHMKCGICDCAYLPKDLPNEVHTLAIQEFFEQANRLALHFSWNTTTLTACKRDASNYTRHKVCRGCYALLEQFRSLFSIGEKYATYFQDDFRPVRSCAKLPQYFPNVRMRKAHANAHQMPDDFQVDPDMLQAMKAHGPIEPVNLTTFRSNADLKSIEAVYNFKEPMLRYRLIFYFRQVTGVPEKYKNCDLDLEMELFDNICTIPLVPCKDPSCLGNPPVPESQVSYKAPEGALLGKALAFKAFQMLTRTPAGLVQWAREKQKLQIFLRANGRNVATVYAPIHQLALEKSLMKNHSLQFKQGPIGYTNLDVALGITGGDVFDAVYTPKVLHERFVYIPPAEFSVPEPLPDAWIELLLNDMDPATTLRAKNKPLQPDSLSQRIIEKIHDEDERKAGKINKPAITPTDELVMPAGSSFESTSRFCSTDDVSSFFASTSRPTSAQVPPTSARPDAAGVDADNRQVYTGSSTSKNYSRRGSTNRQGAVSRPQSATVESGQPASGRVSAGRPASARPLSARPVSATSRLRGSVPEQPEEEEGIASREEALRRPGGASSRLGSSSAPDSRLSSATSRTRPGSAAMEVVSNYAAAEASKAGKRHSSTSNVLPEHSRSSTGVPPSSAGYYARRSQTTSHEKTSTGTLSHYENLVNALEEEEEEDEYGHDIDDGGHLGGPEGRGQNSLHMMEPLATASRSQLAEPLFLEGQLRALHGIGTVGESWYVNVSILDGEHIEEVQTQLKLGPKIGDTFERQVIGPLSLRFCVKLDALDTESLECMRKSLIRVRVYKHDVSLHMSTRKVSTELVEKRKIFGAIEFENLGHHQVKHPSSHMFAAFYLRRAQEMDPAALRNLTASLAWNSAYKRFEPSQDTR
ncbi:unnamed protein product [Amoebophrya sp. A25]|nr:unnamed protein product [Amoebophrya sp. A25]|eukprot:GSA25T00013384001.1